MPNTSSSAAIPLNQLESNNYSVSSYMYPSNLGSPAVNHYMIFHINQQENSASKYKTPDVGGSAPKQKATIQTNSLTDSNGYSSTYSSIKRVSTTIALYMPDDVHVQYSTDWESADLGIADSLVSKDGGLNSINDAFKEVISNVGNNTLKSLSGITGLNAYDAITLRNGIAINPHREMLFRGIGFRQFQFDFKLTPFSEDESLLIDNIIYQFKFNAMPELQQSGGGRFWVYPAEFDIQFFAGSTENLYLPKISTCALTNIAVNYTSAGHFSAHRINSKGAPPVTTNLSLTFSELEVMQKERIRRGF